MTDLQYAGSTRLDALVDAMEARLSIDLSGLPPATSSVNAREFGAKGDDSTNDQASLAAAIVYAKAHSKAVYLPAGVYRHSSTLTLDGVEMWGDGRASVLKATDNVQAAAILTGTAPSLRNVAVTTTGSIIQLGNNASGVLVSVATRPLVQNVAVSLATGVGILVDNSSFGRLVSNDVTGTLKDGIHLTNGSHHFGVAGNVVSGTGDDCIAVVSYVSQGVQCHDIVVGLNIVDTGAARGIAVVGGEGVDILGNAVTNTAAAGIMVFSDASFTSYGSNDVTIALNRIKTTSTGAANQAAVFVQGYTGQKCVGVSILNNNIRDARYGGVSALGFTEEIAIEGNRLYDIFGPAAIETLGSRDVSIQHNRIKQVDAYGVYVDAATAGLVQINSNKFWDINRLNTSGVDVANVAAGSVADQLQFINNYHAQPGGYTIERLLDNSHPNLVANNNHSTVGAAVLTGTTMANIINADNTSYPRQALSAGAPVAGTWKKNDIAWEYAPVATGYVGYVCVTAGIPGTWKGFGLIAS